MKEILKQYKQTEVQNKIQENIRKNRKGNFKLKIRGLDENKSYRVNIKQVKHDFKFGANCFMLDELETENKNELYKERFKQVFNLATLPFYWNGLEPEQGKIRFAVDSPKVYRRPAIDLVMQYCKDNGIQPKLHCLNYEPFIPEWATKLSFDEYKKALEKRFQIIAERYAEVIPDIEVMNEIFQEDKPWETVLRKDVKWSFNTAKKYFKNNNLIINEGQNVYADYLHKNAQYFDLIKENLDNNVPINMVGIQSHMMWCPKECASPFAMWDFFEKYEQLNLPLSITEATIPAFWDGIVDEDLQAELLKGLYSLWFGIENMQAIIYWNIIDGYDHKSIPGDMTSGGNFRRGGLLNFDCSEKKAYKVLNELINKEWKTELTAKTDCGGGVEFEGFYGEYEVSIFTDGKKLSKVICLPKDLDGQEIVLRI